MHDQVLAINWICDRIFYEDLMSARLCITSVNENIIVDFFAVLVVGTGVGGVVEEAEVGRVVGGKHLFDSFPPIIVLHFISKTFEHLDALTWQNFLYQLLDLILWDQFFGHVSDLTNEIFVLRRLFHHQLHHRSHLISLELRKGAADHRVIITTLIFTIMEVRKVGGVDLF